MKKYISLAVGIVLGLCFLVASVPILFNLFTPPAMPADTPAGHFMAAFVPTGYLKFVKTFEFVGGLFVMIPRLRNLGLLLLGPVIVNIIAFHLLVDGEPMHMIKNGMFDVIVVCALYLVWEARHKFSALVN